MTRQAITRITALGPLLFAGLLPASQALAQGVTFNAGDLTIQTPWMRATPKGAKVAGGYLTVTNAGQASDTLKGAMVPIAARSEIHSMRMEGSVMKMAPVPGGLAIQPGETVELKPGGYHLMFLDLQTPPKVGDSVQGTLSFERAGPVAVTFTVAPIGAASPDGKAATPSGAHKHH